MPVSFGNASADQGRTLHHCIVEPSSDGGIVKELDVVEGEPGHNVEEFGDSILFVLSLVLWFALGLMIVLTKSSFGWMFKKPISTPFFLGYY